MAERFKIECLKENKDGFTKDHIYEIINMRVISGETIFVVVDDNGEKKEIFGSKIKNLPSRKKVINAN